MNVRRIKVGGAEFEAIAAAARAKHETRRAEVGVCRRCEFHGAATDLVGVEVCDFGGGARVIIHAPWPMCGIKSVKCPRGAVAKGSRPESDPPFIPKRHTGSKEFDD